MAEMKIADLARQIDGDVVGDGSVVVTGVAGVAEAGPGDLSFIHSAKYIDAVKHSKASALIVSRELETDFRPLIRTANPYQAFAKAIGLLVELHQPPPPGIHPTATVAESARIADDASIGAHVVVEEGAVIGSGSVLRPGVYVGALCQIGDQALIYPNVTINTQCLIGDNVIIHSGTTVGADNGADETEAGTHRVLLEDDVEIGANCSICLGDPPTVLGRGTKLDNLVNIGPGATIEEECIIVAQVLVGAGAVVGRGATIAGQVSIQDGVKVGSSSMVAAKSVVTKDVPPNSVVSGAPAVPHALDMKLDAYMKRLPNIVDRIQRIESTLRGKDTQG